ncbi:hypothetical protein AMATHDRAFT_200154 [Amanita thiersii Skay4041]|uniref:Uncharacterized protein n=1 Tax=Amanita thiersii Skay4041 TaxID=703135 RepID=A0A2A9NDW5_9AGAR|nr:hypothetical protein AMATHDRAFT_200154 [Amanita thiersii Skay4041]
MSANTDLSHLATHDNQFKPSHPFEPQQSPTNLQRTSERFSIDLSLELEHQLEHMESSLSNSAIHSSESSEPKHESLDPHILAHIIMQLRQSIAEITKERDELTRTLSSALSKEAELSDVLQLMTDKATELEEELLAARRKMKEDEEAIALLRSKVEESRRGLMRLQTESRRQSSTIDLSRGQLPVHFGLSPSASKRASFTPLTGSLHAGRPNGHRRISSVSDANLAITPVPPDFTSTIEDTAVPENSFASRHVSGIFGRQSPPHTFSQEISQKSESQHAVELELLKKELQSVKDALEITNHELSESNEAREASETCVKALREFIADNTIGVWQAGESAAIKLPPPPTMTTGEEIAAKKGTGTTPYGGWGLGKLWRADSPVKTPMSTSALGAMSPVVTPVSETPRSTSTASPLTRKFGGFFNSRSSVSSSTNSVTSRGGTSLQSNAATSACLHRESVCNFSDASSITEPASPQGEAVNGDTEIPGIVIREQPVLPSLDPECVNITSSTGCKNE